MAGKKIFISYRRQDAGGEAGRLSDVLQNLFPQDRIFMDVDTIQPGADFVEVINNAVSSCDVMLVMIGPHWVNIKDASGKRRLENPDDFVRLEISAALRRSILVIPVLVNGADMPNADQLPDELDALCRRHAHELSSSRWKYDSEQLIQHLEKSLGIKRKVKDEKIPGSIYPPPQQKSWWAKNYIWVIGVVTLIIILLSLPDTEDPYIDDPDYPQQYVFDPEEDELDTPSSREEFIDNPAETQLPNLRGRWSGVNTLGIIYYFDITQNGNQLNYTEYSFSGEVTANGTGILEDRDIELSYNSAFDFYGNLELTLSNDGLNMNGTIYLPDAGTSSPVTLTKSH